MRVTGKQGIMILLRSNNFVYKENINAGYINYNRQFKGFYDTGGASGLKIPMQPEPLTRLHMGW